MSHANANAAPAFFVNGVESFQSFMQENGWSALAFLVMGCVAVSYLAPVVSKFLRGMSSMTSGRTDRYNDDIALARREQEERLRKEAELEAQARRQKEIERRREKQQQAEEELGQSGGRRLGDGKTMSKSKPKPSTTTRRSGYNPLNGGGGGGGWRPSDRHAGTGGG